jgi:hypothetical protein
MLHYTTTGEAHRTLGSTVLVCAPLHFIQYVGHGGCVIYLPFNALLLFKEEKKTRLDNKLVQKQK